MNLHSLNERLSGEQIGALKERREREVLPGFERPHGPKFITKRERDQIDQADLRRAQKENAEADRDRMVRNQKALLGISAPQWGAILGPIVAVIAFFSKTYYLGAATFVAMFTIQNLLLVGIIGLAVGLLLGYLIRLIRRNW